MEYWLEGMSKKIGLKKFFPEDELLIKELLEIMHQSLLDYSFTFRLLSEYLINLDNIIESFEEQFKSWVKKWQNRLLKENQSLDEIRKLMCSVNPAIIPRNHQVEKVINFAIEKNDFSKMENLLKALQDPYVTDTKFHEYTIPPEPNQRVCQTFCGT